MLSVGRNLGQLSIRSRYSEIKFKFKIKSIKLESNFRIIIVATGDMVNIYIYKYVLRPGMYINIVLNIYINLSPVATIIILKFDSSFIDLN